MTQTPHSPCTESEKAAAIALGISFDGKQYRYLDYRYDRLSDAVSYAHRESDDTGYRIPAGTFSEWKAPIEPTVEQAAQMAASSITFDGRSYIFAEYRYDRLADALIYARLHPAR